MFSRLLLMCCLCLHLTAGYFEASNDKKDYKSASAYCQRYKGRLASLTMTEAKKFSSAKHKDEFWVGLKRVSGGWRYDDGTVLNEEEFAALPNHTRHEPAHYKLRPNGGTWQWTDDQPFSFDNPMWVGGEIAKYGECGALKGPGQITAINCRRVRRFICEYPGDSDSGNTVDIGNFEVSDTEADYKDATKHCESNNGRLAILTKAQAYKFTSAKDKDEIWVGVRRVSGDWRFYTNDTLVTEEEFADLPEHIRVEPHHYKLRPSGGRWQWSDGTQFFLDNEMWVGGSPEPEYVYGTCGALRRPGQITALNCRRTHRFICEYQA